MNSVRRDASGRVASSLSQARRRETGSRAVALPGARDRGWVIAGREEPDASARDAQHSAPVPALDRRGLRPCSACRRAPSAAAQPPRLRGCAGPRRPPPLQASRALSCLPAAARLRVVHSGRGVGGRSRTASRCPRMAVARVDRSNDLSALKNLTKVRVRARRRERPRQRARSTVSRPHADVRPSRLAQSRSS